MEREEKANYRFGRARQHVLFLVKSHKESLELHKMYYAGEGLVAIVMGEEHYYI